MVHKMFHFLIIIISLATTLTADNENQFLCSNGTRIHTPNNHWAEKYVETKDVQIDPATGLSGRLYHPKLGNIPFMHMFGLPVIVYFHGGAAFCSGSSFSAPYHNFSLTLSAKANAVVLAVEYRSAPKSPIRVGYEDSWTALKWVANNTKWIPGHEPWLKRFAGINRVYLAGDGVGANIAHNMGIRFGLESLPGVNITGIILIHPLLWVEYETRESQSRSQLPGEPKPRPDGKEANAKQWINRLWKFVSPSSSGLNDLNVTPVWDTNLCKIGSKRVIVAIAGDDPLAAANNRYVEALKNRGWKGEVEVVESKGKQNGFYLDPKYANKTEASEMLDKLVSFIQTRRN